MCWEAVLNTWPGSGKASVAKYVAYPCMRGTAHDLSVDKLSQLKFIENGSRMAKGIQYKKTTQIINVNENFKKQTIKQTIKTVQ